SAMNSSRASVADLARLNFVLGELYADAVLSSERRIGARAELIGCHGQTIYHQGLPKKYLGHNTPATWQTGESAMIAARLRRPVVADFRPADLAEGGQGAPLVPFFDYVLYRDQHLGRLVQNIGGIANLTAIPAGARLQDITAFDTGPGNMVIDALTQRFVGMKFDRGGEIAASGKILTSVFAHFLRHPFFRREPPKSAGREEFGRQFVEDFIQRCGPAAKNDVVATATALTAKSIAAACQILLRQDNFQEFIVSGGGTKNHTLMSMLTWEMQRLGLRIRLADDFGIPSAAKEAAAFALLAYQTWNHQTSNVPSATGATRAAILGKICYV
ncbi:MAG: anhydro-N-acetylmuramic acid kinase, partial [Acidobacteriales bacterium]|nr:anhydro-N-acetylmuramic acid kinase [Terriglobales bacterium]